MPSKPAENPEDVEEFGIRGAVDGEDRRKPPWERSNLGYAMGEAKADKEIKARVTPGMLRIVQRIVQQRKIPQIETQSDIVRLGVFWVNWWATNIAVDDKEIQRQLDLLMWAGEVEYREHSHRRLEDILDKIEGQLDAAKVEGRFKEHAAILGELKKNSALIDDEKLAAKAKRIWIKHHKSPEGHGKG